jgi:hypothetical protein
MLIPPKFKFIGGFIMQKISDQVISLFFNSKYSCLKKQTICKRLNISIYELDRILDNYYAELDKSNVFSQAWTQVHQNSYMIPKKQSFIDSIVQSEHEKQIRQRLKEKSCLEGGVAV